MSTDQTSVAAASTRTPLIARLACEIPKPKDWQAFQRNCVLLFRADLGDPNAQEYGRSGQNQSGIDILGVRRGDPKHYVGIQCRHIAKPLKEAKIEEDCRVALKLSAGLKELIFATTAPDDTRASDAAVAVEQRLQSEGHNLRVVVYGWGQLQILIAVHEVAYNAFCPSHVASYATQTPTTNFESSGDISTLAAQIADQLRKSGISLSPTETKVAGSNQEDPALHARIDVFRDIFQEQPHLAEGGLRKMLEQEHLEAKPWARFRIETNLGWVALSLEREAEAADRFQTAYTVRPDDPNAVANLALARMFQGRIDDAMNLARKALESTPRVDRAVCYLLQATARSTWQGDPETLIPADLVGSDEADLGLAEFLRQRDVPGWPERSLELSRRHPEVDVFKRVRAFAVLVLATESGAFLPGGHVPVALDELNGAADDMKMIAEHYLDIGYADEQNLAGHINNAAVLLHYSGRQPECQALLRRGLPKTPNALSLRRMLATLQAADGRRSEALATLAITGDDPQSQLMSLELSAPDDPIAAVSQAMAMDTGSLGTSLNYQRWQLVGELALKIGDMVSLEAAISGLRKLDATDIVASLLEIRGERKGQADNTASQEKLRALAAALPEDLDMAMRFTVADALYDQDLPEEAAALLEGHVVLSRRSPATKLYLQSLAAARRDEAFRDALAAATPTVRESPEILSTVAAHAWNLGDLFEAFRANEALLAQRPNDPRARLFRIEILVRQDRSAELLAELDKPIEDLGWTRLEDQFRVASLLGHFGYIERAIAFAYRLFLAHRDTSQAWMTLLSLVLNDGIGDPDGPSRWEAPVVAEDVAVDIRYDDGEDVYFVIEPDAALRALDQDESWEPEHPLAQSLMGLSAGATFVGPTGRAGSIIQVRHKYVARLHYVMKRHEMRFPMAQAFRLINVNANDPNGLDWLVAELKDHRKWGDKEQELYHNGPMPLGVLAHRVGRDMIDAASGLAANGVPLKVALGNQTERDAAALALQQNAGKGCILDLLAFWTAWRLGSLDAIAAICGPVHLPQRVMDRLRARRERIGFSAKDGMLSIGYESGQLVRHEVAPEVVVEWSNDIDRMIAWADSNAIVCPLIVADNVPAPLRELLRAGRTDIFDAVALSIQSGILLVTDDFPMRALCGLGEGPGAVWLHHLFMTALDRGLIDLVTYVRWTANIIDAGHSYISIKGRDLLQALQMDVEVADTPGYFFTSVSKMIGGRIADPRSHIAVCRDFLRDIWTDSAATTYRQPATGHLLTQLLRERVDDYTLILKALTVLVSDMPALVDYIHDWAHGHFIPEALIADWQPSI